MPSQYAVSGPRAGSLAESRRHAESICGAQPLSRITGGVTETCQVNVRAQPPSRVAGGVTETRRVVLNLFAKNVPRNQGSSNPNFSMG
jgi:hypothetical protein